MSRPVISTYSDIAQFIGDMIRYRKITEPGFSVLQSCAPLRRVSPTLVTLVVKGKRLLTLDRVEEFSRLLDLTSSERKYFKDWVTNLHGESEQSEDLKWPKEGRRIHSTAHILTDWINVFVKDAFQIKKVRRDPRRIYQLLSGVGTRKRIDQSIKFLIRHGYLRKNIAGQLTPEVPLHSVDQKIPSVKVRQFHKAALKIAGQALDRYPTIQRHANAIVMPLTPKRYLELVDLIGEFSEKLQKFAEESTEGDALYQIVVHASPTGGVCE